MPRIDIVLQVTAWKKLSGLSPRLQRAAKAVVANLPKRLVFPASVTLVLTNDRAVHALNRDFRGMDKPTNVLSFPQFAPGELGKCAKAKQPVHLGDIILGYQYIVVEAINDRKILINHVTHLFIHGFLHLLGYDHDTDEKASRMERLEQKIMDRLKLPDPYATIEVPTHKTKTKKK